MKTILVPTEPNAQMRSTLETALLVAREFNSYIEGFAVRVAVPERGGDGCRPFWVARFL